MCIRDRRYAARVSRSAPASLRAMLQSAGARAWLDEVCVAGTHDGRVAEYSDHLHEHLHDPVVMKDGCYMPPEAPGYGVRFTAAALDGYEWPRPAP